MCFEGKRKKEEESKAQICDYQRMPQAIAKTLQSNDDLVPNSKNLIYATGHYPKFPGEIATMTETKPPNLPRFVAEFLKLRLWDAHISRNNRLGLGDPFFPKAL